MLNILHATDYHTRANTGITFAINGLIGQIERFLPAESKIALMSVGEVDVEPPAGTLSVRVPPSSIPFTGVWRFSWDYRAACERVIAEHRISVVHIHGVWMHPHYAAVQAASNLGVPTVLTNHGHLEHWALRERGKVFKKWLYLAIMRDRLFRKITVFHAITPLNKSMIHKLFPGSRIELIPNSIDLAEVDIANANAVRQIGIAPYVLFLGRLAPQKGIDLLIQAFGRARLPRDWKLLIAGPEEFPRYVAHLRQLIAASPHASQIELIGPVWDSQEKYRLMRNAWLMAVPSRSEVVGLVNLEASACSTPTITTRTTGLIDWEQGGGLLTDPTIQDLTVALDHAGRWSETERAERGRASRRLVEQCYSTRVTGPRWVELYRSLSP